MNFYSPVHLDFSWGDSAVKRHWGANVKQVETPANLLVWCQSESPNYAVSIAFSRRQIVFQLKLAQQFFAFGDPLLQLESPIEVVANNAGLNIDFAVFWAKWTF